MKNRIDNANKLLEFIAKHGRNFFLSTESGAVCHFYKRGVNSVGYHDVRSKKNMSVTYNHHDDEMNIRSYHFMHGGTLREFVETLAEYIKFNRVLNYGCCGMTSEQYWAYGKDGKKVAYYAVKLGIMKSEVK